jgi:hypothetical protein
MVLKTITQQEVRPFEAVSWMGMWDPSPWLHIALDFNRQSYEISLAMMVEI